jgi:hypothetical protein
MQPGKMEEALVARGATVSFQVHGDTHVMVTSLPYWDAFVSEAQVMVARNHISLPLQNVILAPLDLLLTQPLSSGGTSACTGSKQHVGAPKHVAGQTASPASFQDPADSQQHFE